MRKILHFFLHLANRRLLGDYQAFCLPGLKNMKFVFKKYVVDGVKNIEPYIYDQSSKAGMIVTGAIRFRKTSALGIEIINVYIYEAK